MPREDAAGLSDEGTPQRRWHPAPNATDTATAGTLNTTPKRPNPMKTLQVCRYYCWGGFCFLPCLWLVNVLWFFPEAFGHAELSSGDPNDDRSDETEVEAEERRTRIRAAARRYVIISGLGTVVCGLVLAAWIYLYQTRRSAWGVWGDDISAIIPRGKPEL